MFRIPNFKRRLLGCESTRSICDLWLINSRARYVTYFPYPHYPCVGQMLIIPFSLTKSLKSLKYQAMGYDEGKRPIAMNLKHLNRSTKWNSLKWQQGYVWINVSNEDSYSNKTNRSTSSSGHTKRKKGDFKQAFRIWNPKPSIRYRQGINGLKVSSKRYVILSKQCTSQLTSHGQSGGTATARASG